MLLHLAPLPRPRASSARSRRRPRYTEIGARDSARPLGAVAQDSPVDTLGER
jgi:hypothetical protein